MQEGRYRMRTYLILLLGHFTEYSGFADLLLGKELAKFRCLSLPAKVPVERAKHLLTVILSKGVNSPVRAAIPSVLLPNPFILPPLDLSRIVQL